MILSCVCGSSRVYLCFVLWQNILSCVCGSSPTSYLTIEEADGFIAGQRGFEAWMSLSEQEKKVILNQASLVVDGAFSYKGKRTDKNQLLKFPRGGATSIPAGVGFAVALLSLQYAKDEALKGITSESIGKMSWTFGKAQNGLTNEILSFLRKFRAKGVRINE